MKFSKRVTYMLLGFFLILTACFQYRGFLLLVYPNIGGGDTFVLQQLSESISDTSYAQWLIHPLSYMGLYPLSYPSGYPFHLSFLTVSTTLASSDVILLSDQLLAYLGVLLVFVITRRFKPREDLYWLCSLIAYTTMPHAIGNTLWTASARMPFTIFLLMLFFFIFQYYDTGKTKNILMILLIVFMLITLHRLMVFLIIIVFAMFLTKFWPWLKNRIRKKLDDSGMGEWLIIKENSTKIYLLFFMFILAFLVQLLPLSIYDTMNLWASHYDSLFFNDGDVNLVTRMFNFAFELLTTLGFLQIFFILGLIALIKRELGKKTGKFLFFLMFFMTFFIAMPETYLYPIFIPMATFISGLGLMHFLGRAHLKKLAPFVLIGLLATSIFFAGYMEQYYLGRSELPIPESNYRVSMYVKYEMPVPFLSDEGYLASEISALGGNIPYMPAGGPTFPITSPQDLTFGFIDPDEMDVVLIDFMYITPNTDTVFAVTNVHSLGRWSSLMQNGINSTVLTDSTLRLLVTTSDEPKQIYFTRRYDSPLKEEVFIYRYKIYDDSYSGLGPKLWMLQPQTNFELDPKPVDLG